MDKSAILQLDMRLGEGTGAAVALSVLREAAACHNQMATFNRRHSRYMNGLRRRGPGGFYV